MKTLKKYNREDVVVACYLFNTFFVTKELVNRYSSNLHMNILCNKNAYYYIK